MKSLKKNILTLLTLSLVGTCMSCNNNKNNSGGESTDLSSVDSLTSASLNDFGTKIPEDLTSTNIIKDKYRNYYEIFVRSFRDSNGDGIGDLQGVIEKLDYLKDLGFNGIWLMPINVSSSYHKYDVKDYYNIDPSYGTMSDLEQLIYECHKRDIKIIIDLVLNHSGRDNPWFNQAVNAHEKELTGQELTSEDLKYKDFYTFFDTREDVPSSINAYYQVSGHDFYYEANFSTNMPEFNLDSEAVKEEFQKIIRFYLDKGIDGFRLDAVTYYYYKAHSKNIEFLSLLNSWIKSINPDAYIVGECWEGGPIIEQYYQSGCDSFFNFTTSVNDPSGSIVNSLNLEGRMVNKYYDGLQSNIEMANGYIPAPFLDNHDMARFTFASRPELSKFKYALLSMMNGATFTYYGDEVGMVGNNPPDENVRIPILWGEENNYGDCSMISGVNAYSYPHGSVSSQMSDPNSLINFYKKCLLIRNQNPEIARGEIALVTIKRDYDSEKYLFIKKTYDGNTIGIIFNFSPTLNVNVDYKNEGFNQVVGQLTAVNDTYIGLQENGTITLPPMSIAIVK